MSAALDELEAIVGYRFRNRDLLSRALTHKSRLFDCSGENLSANERMEFLGDSILDNGRYVPGGPSVIEHLRKALPAGWRATLLARDGAGTAELPRQLDLIPADATHFVVSVGGNDALDHSGLLLHEPAGSFAEVLSRLADIRDQFQKDYRGVVQAVLARGLPTAVCTVYDAIPGLDRVEAGADMIFPEAITELPMYKKFADAVKVPILANITEFGQTPLFTAEELRSANVAMVLYPLSAFRAMNAAALRVYEGIRKDGTQKGVVELMQSRDDLYKYLDYHSFEGKLDTLFAQSKNK